MRALPLPVVAAGERVTFIGMDAAIDIAYTTKNDEETVCHFCPNECKRTFIDTVCPDGSEARYISGFSCEKGTVESKEAMLALVKERKAMPRTASVPPNLHTDKEPSGRFFVILPRPQSISVDRSKT